MVTPWYKQFWPWFLIILPLIVVTWTIGTVVVFSQHSVSLVTEDYYKKGKGINIDFTKINVAKSLLLSATIYSDGQDVVIDFDKGKLATYPALLVMFAHRTLPDRDFSQLVSADASGHYRLSLKEAMQGPWFIEITPHDKQWLIQGRMNFPSTSHHLLVN
jgi:hypothetical protein